MRLAIGFAVGTGVTSRATLVGLDATGRVAANGVVVLGWQAAATSKRTSIGRLRNMAISRKVIDRRPQSPAESRGYAG